MASASKQEAVQDNVLVNPRGDGLCFIWSILLYRVLLEGINFSTLEDLREELKVISQHVKPKAWSEILNIGSQSLLASMFNNQNEIDEFIQHGIKPDAFSPELWSDLFTEWGISACVLPDDEPLPDDLNEFFDGHENLIFGEGKMRVFVKRIGNHYNAILPQESLDVSKMKPTKMVNVDNLIKAMFPSGDGDILLKEHPDAFPHLVQLKKDIYESINEINEKISAIDTNMKAYNYTLEDLRVIVDILK